MDLDLLCAGNKNFRAKVACLVGGFVLLVVILDIGPSVTWRNLLQSEAQLWERICYARKVQLSSNLGTLSRPRFRRLGILNMREYAVLAGGRRAGETSPGGSDSRGCSNCARVSRFCRVRLLCGAAQKPFSVHQRISRAQLLVRGPCRSCRRLGSPSSGEGGAAAGV